jgi:alcohol dehydrogenase (cytochrome c)
MISIRRGLGPVVGLMAGLALCAPPALALIDLGEDQPTAGMVQYNEHCASCHGDHLQGGAGPALTGPAFTARWSQPTRTVSDLYYVMRTSMPKPSNGSLEKDQYLAILAFVLQKNGVPRHGPDLTEDPGRLASIKMSSDPAAQAPPKKTWMAGDRATPIGKGPSAAELAAAKTSTDWLYSTHDFSGQRHAPISQINTGNAGRLAPVCLYQFGSVENFVTGPIAYKGVLYVTTPHITAAIDAATCKEIWRYKWEPQDAELWSNNRGVAIEDGYVVRGTADGYLLALDAADGHLLWGRQVAHPAEGEQITMPPLIDKDLIIIAPAGSELNIQGWVGAFKLSDGSPVWRFNTIPKPGEPGYDTWPHRPDIPSGGASVWAPMTFDADRGEVYLATTNPAPDIPSQLRSGTNLYTNSLIALDVRTGKLNWYAQMDPNDNKDWDLTQASPIVDGTVDGKARKMIVAGGKDGVLRVIDRDSHKILHQTDVGTHLNPDAQPGTRFCPGAAGGIQWNGPAYAPETNALYVPSVDWCSTITLDEKPPRFIPGELYMGGSVKMDPTSQGFLTSIDLATGKTRWRYRSDKPMVAAATTTAGGLVFAGENSGDFLALNADTGEVLYRFNTGGAMTAGIISYAVDGKQYVAAASGHGSINFGEGRGSPTIIIFTLPETAPASQTAAR